MGWLYHLNAGVTHGLEDFLETAVPMIAGLAEVQGLENIFPSCTDHFAVIQALDHVHIKRIKFNRIVMYFPLMHLGIQQSQEGIEPSTETYFQNDDFFPFQMV